MKCQIVFCNLLAVDEIIIFDGIINDKVDSLFVGYSEGRTNFSNHRFLLDKQLDRNGFYCECLPDVENMLWHSYRSVKSFTG